MRLPEHCPRHVIDPSNPNRHPRRRHRALGAGATLRLYERLGYRPIGLYHDYYEDHSDALRTAIHSGRVPLVLISSYRFNRTKAPHWVVVGRRSAGETSAPARP